MGRGRLWCARMGEETIAQRVIRVIARNKKMAPEELCAATRFDELKMDSLDALNMIFAFNCRRFSS
jgi:acyl carrier protein